MMLEKVLGDAWYFPVNVPRKIFPCAYCGLFSFTVCLQVNMYACLTSKMSTSPSDKTYCYDVRYSQYDRYPGVLMTDNVWSRLACCEMQKNGTVSANFMVCANMHYRTGTDVSCQFPMKSPTVVPGSPLAVSLVPAPGSS